MESRALDFFDHVKMSLGEGGTHVAEGMVAMVVLLLAVRGAGHDFTTAVVLVAMVAVVVVYTFPSSQSKPQAVMQKKQEEEAAEAAQKLKAKVKALEEAAQKKQEDDEAAAKEAVRKTSEEEEAATKLQAKVKALEEAAQKKQEDDEAAAKEAARKTSEEAEAATKKREEEEMAAKEVARKKREEEEAAAKEAAQKKQEEEARKTAQKLEEAEAKVKAFEERKKREEEEAAESARKVKEAEAAWKLTESEAKVQALEEEAEQKKEEEEKSKGKRSPKAWTKGFSESFDMSKDDHDGARSPRSDGAFARKHAHKHQHIQQLMDLSGMSQLSRDQENFLMTLSQTRYSHIMVSSCKFIVCAFVAKVKSGEDLSHLARNPDSSMTKEEACTVVREKVMALNDAIKKCDRANWDKKNRFAALAIFRTVVVRVCKQWIGRLERWERQYGRFAPQLVGCIVSEGDFVAAPSAVSARDVIYKSMIQKIDQWQEEGANLSKSTCLHFTQETVNASQSMMEGIVHSSVLTCLEKERLEDDMRESDKLFRRRCELSTSFRREQANEAALTKEIADAEHTINRQIDSLQADLERLQTVKLREGRGYWAIKGKPNDAQSRKLRNTWDEGRVDDLEFYSSGSFECRFVPKMTDTQREVREHEAELEDQLKKKHKAKTDLKSKEQALAQSQTEVKILEERLKDAKEVHMAAEKKLKEGMTRLSPAQSAQILGMKRVAEAMSQSAKIFHPCQMELDAITGVLEDLHSQLDCKDPLIIVLETVRDLCTGADDVEESNMVLLSGMGEANLNDFLLPAQDPAAASLVRMEDIDRWKEQVDGTKPEEQALLKIIDETEQSRPTELD